MPELITDINGNIVTASGKKVWLGIRPESAEKEYPGDDLILTFTAEDKKGKGRELTIQAKASDYIAVYDKKLLWRANLYIYKKESALGDIDWNDAHPWNVPPAAGVEQEDARPKSWSAAWGYNEWNRKYDGSQTANSLSGLAAGNGGQVVTFPEFTPLRTIPAGNETNPTAGNVIGKTVAYSYPDHPEEKPDDSKGDAGSMDSPFDFVWKMEKQKSLLASAYDTSGDVKIASGTSSWDDTKSPKNRWNKYKRGTTAGQAFIPSLGLYYGARHLGFSTTSDEDGLPSDTASTWNWKYTFEAGTDCVGFSQRAASYKGRKYSWWSLPRGIMETGNTDYNTVQDGYGKNDEKRNFVRATGIYTINSWNIINKNRTDAATAENLIELKKVVPGDIWVKYKVAVNVQDTNKDTIPAHIAIVAYVPPNASELSASELMNQIILVEAEYNNKIKTVIKVLSIGDYNNNHLVSSREIYPGISFMKGSLDLHCDSWAIRRLK
ncbi:MAG: hypothetical protein M0P01_05325 [Treponema sp.]|nr:hypothetical protein [Treponema sp.]